MTKADHLAAGQLFEYVIRPHCDSPDTQVHVGIGLSMVIGCQRAFDRRQCGLGLILTIP